ncbi:hypothetical protein QQ045_000666 [Rhodiola kirilowii]
MAATKKLYTFTISFMILFYLATTTSTTTAAVPKTSTTFIKSSCRATLYPTLCVQSLSLYAASIKLSPQKLTHTALLISLAKAKSTRTYISIMSKTNGLKRADRAALKDCLENMGAAEDRIRGSVQEMGKLGKASTRELRWIMSNVQTWVSAALSGENTCGDGLSEESQVSRRVRNGISPMLVNVKQVTSNALALINLFVDKY